MYHTYEIIATYETRPLRKYLILIQHKDCKRYFRGTMGDINSRMNKLNGGGMFIEGLINKHVLEILIAAGHEPDWVIDNNKDAKKKGYDGFDDSTTLGTDKVIIRLWIDMNTEDFFDPEKLAKEDELLLPLMATSPYEKFREVAERTLKAGTSCPKKEK